MEDTAVLPASRTNNKRQSSRTLTEEPADTITTESPQQREEYEYIENWAGKRLNRSRGRVELLMVYVRNEEDRGHNYDTPSVFEQGFIDFCNLPA